MKTVASRKRLDVDRKMSSDGERFSYPTVDPELLAAATTVVAVAATIPTTNVFSMASGPPKPLKSNSAISARRVS